MLIAVVGVWRGSAGDWYVLPLLLVFVAASFASRYWRFFVQWLNGIRGREWGLVQAIIDVVSVVEQTEQTKYGERTVGYLATLTYFYRNPDLQMGEFSKMFDLEDQAKTWVDSLKGSPVMVHVDPRDPSRSALREDELNGSKYSMQ